MQRKDGEGRKEGWRGGRHRGGKRETEKMSQSWTEKWRERTGEEKKESSLHTLFMLFKTFWVHMIGRHQCEALLCSHYGFDQRWQSEGGRQKEGSRHVISPLPDIWIAAHISDFSGIKKKKKKRVSCSLKNNRVSRVRVGSVQLANKRDVTEKRSSGRTRWFDVIKLS